MAYRIVLDIGATADRQALHVSPQDGPEPDADLITQFHVADHGGVWRHVDADAEARRPAVERIDHRACPCRATASVALRTVSGSPTKSRDRGRSPGSKV